MSLRLRQRGLSVLNGLNLSIDLPLEHWLRVRQNEALKRIRDDDVRVDHLCERVEVPLAFIPADEFAVHQADFSVMGWAFETAFEHMVKDRAGMRAAFGWKGRAQRAHSYNQQTPADRSNEIEHRYFRVSHSTL